MKKLKTLSTDRRIHFELSASIKFIFFIMESSYLKDNDMHSSISKCCIYSCREIGRLTITKHYRKCIYVCKEDFYHRYLQNVGEGCIGVYSFEVLDILSSIFIVTGFLYEVLTLQNSEHALKRKPPDVTKLDEVSYHRYLYHNMIELI